MAGFLENLLRQGTEAGLGFRQGQRAGEAEQQQALIDAQKRQLEMAMLQAQIDRTGRQDIANPLDDDLLRARIGQAERAGQPLDPESIEGQRMIALTGQANRSGQPQPTVRSRGEVTAGAKGLARNFADNAIRGGTTGTIGPEGVPVPGQGVPFSGKDEIEALKPVLLQSIRAEFPELGIGEAVGIVDAAFASASRVTGLETGSILELAEEEAPVLEDEGALAPTPEPWESNEDAVDMIRRLEASNDPDKESKIAEVKRLAAELAGA